MTLVVVLKYQNKEAKTVINLEQLDGIKWSQHDEQNDTLLAWHGGHGIHGYDNEGRECYFWNMGGAKSPSLEEAQKNIAERIKAQNYLECY